VAGVFEKVGSETDAAELDTLFCAKVPVRQDGNSSFMHNKVIVVDERYVITGSLNSPRTLKRAMMRMSLSLIILILRTYMQNLNGSGRWRLNPIPKKSLVNKLTM